MHRRIAMRRVTGKRTLLLIAVTGPASAPDRPNVVIMLADNVGSDDIGAYGAGEVRGMPTPRIDQIASEGLRLTHYLVEPDCTPSRAALMTGRYSPRSGLRSPMRPSRARAASLSVNAFTGKIVKVTVVQK